MAKPKTDKKKESPVPEAAELADEELETVAGGRFTLNRGSDRDNYDTGLIHSVQS